jgi:hypothetical protein
MAQWSVCRLILARILSGAKYSCGTENNNQNNFDVNGNLLNLNNIANLEWNYNNTLNKLTKANKSNTIQYYVSKVLDCRWLVSW